MNIVQEELAANFMQALRAHGKSNAAAYAMLLELYGRDASGADLFKCPRCCALEKLLKEKQCA